MLAQALPERKKLAVGYFESFQNRGWPNVTLITGPQTEGKQNLIASTIKKELHRNQYHETKELDSISVLLGQDSHPDAYIFPDAPIPIGEDSSSGKTKRKTIRHLLHHFIPYSPTESRLRFVWFQNAGRLLNEAESALLKVLEEPPKNTHFILCAEQEENMKTTILSRCFHIPFIESYGKEDLPQDSWDRFWYMSGYSSSIEYKLIQEEGWLEEIKKAYDGLSFNQNDFVIFDEIGMAGIKKKFRKESSETRNLILVLTFMPLYISIRDSILNGTVPSLGAINFPSMELPKAYRAYLILRDLFYYLRKKYFGTRTVSAIPVFYHYLSSLMTCWHFGKES